MAKGFQTIVYRGSTKHIQPKRIMYTTPGKVLEINYFPRTNQWTYDFDGNCTLVTARWAIEVIKAIGLSVEAREQASAS